MSRFWYAYIGTTGGEGVPGNYKLVKVPPNTFCTGGSQVCAIYALGGGASPSSISANIKNYIIIAKGRNSAEPHLTGQKPYVYTSQP